MHLPLFVFDAIYSYEGHCDILSMLVNAGCAVDARNKTQDTPLHWASRRGHADACRLLIETGADVNAKERSLYTPLHYASANGYLDVVKVLAAANAELGAVDKKGRTPMDLSTGDTRKYLINHSASVEIDESLTKALQEVEDMLAEIDNVFEFGGELGGNKKGVLGKTEDIVGAAGFGAMSQRESGAVEKKKASGGRATKLKVKRAQTAKTMESKSKHAIEAENAMKAFTEAEHTEKQQEEERIKRRTRRKRKDSGHDPHEDAPTSTIISASSPIGVDDYNLDGVVESLDTILSK